ncbi:MAG: family oxidoreductase [Nocardioides sp.]|nr:family oxidoreductase [Nocardioides sp.]
MAEQHPRPVALVTGAGRRTGIGRSIAERLLRDGYAVAISDIGERFAEKPDYEAVEMSELDATVAELAVLGEVLAVRCDVRDEVQVDAMAAQVVEHFGRLDVLVNNAGVGGGLGEVVDMALADWQLNIDVMATGVFLCSRAVARHLVDRGEGGRIITIASQAGKSGMPLLGAYSAAKFAAIGLTQAMAHELGPHGVTVNAICPGTIDTPMLEFDGGLMDVYSRRFNMEKDQYRRRVTRTIPLGRFGQPADIAGCVSWLASDDASFVTGEAVNVTGGQEMH